MQRLASWVEIQKISFAAEDIVRAAFAGLAS
jgi:hypothetical protein